MLYSGRIAAFAFLATAGITAAGCGGSSDFKDEPRPPEPVQLTGVIRNDKLTVSPNRVGAGPIIILISNQTQQAHTVTLDGVDTRDTVGPVNPLDSAKIQQTLKQGKYTVKAGSTQAVPREIAPATLSVGPQRRDSSNKVLLP
jgi:endonuclease YncB( thermonuclease family)